LYEKELGSFELPRALLSFCQFIFNPRRAFCNTELEKQMPWQIKQAAAEMNAERR